MAFWRQVPLIALFALFIGMVTGCTPASNSPFDEEKDPYVVQGRNRESEYNDTGAIESYQRALEVNPRSSVAHYRLGLLYEKDDRDPAAAIYHFQQFLTLRPNSEQATVIRQRILGCKQELAKEVSLGLVNGEMKDQLDRLIQKNQRLEEENQRLTEESRQLKVLVARLQPGQDSTRPAPVSGTPSRPAFDQPMASASTPTGTTHTVQKGDTYYSIAKRYGISTSALQAANPGVNPNRLSIGQRLIVPPH